MSKSFIRIEGDKEFKALLKNLSAALENKIMREIARKGGNIVKKKARVSIPGYLGIQIKKDIGVVSDKKNKSGVVVKLRSKEFPDRKGKSRVVSKIARHMTEGSKQSARFTKGKKYRGRVSKKYPDFIQDAGQSSKAEVMKVMQNETMNVIRKHVQKYARKK